MRIQLALVMPLPRSDCDIFHIEILQCMQAATRRMGAQAVEERAIDQARLPTQALRIRISLQLILLVSDRVTRALMRWVPLCTMSDAL